MKICIIGLEISPRWTEGVKNNAFNLAKHLKKQGVDVFVLTMSRVLPEESIIEGVKFYAVKTADFDNKKELYQSLPNLPKFIKFSRKVIEKEKPDVIHGNHYVLSMGVIDKLVNSTGAKCVETIYGDFYDLSSMTSVNGFTFISEQLPHLLINNPLVTYLASTQYDAVLTPNNYLKNKLLNAAKLIEVIPNGVDTEKFRPLKSYDSFYKQHKINPKEPKVIYLGHLTYAKGVKFLIESFANFTKTYPKAQLIIAWSGAGTQNEEVFNLIKNKGIEKNIIKIGVVDVNEAMGCADVFVLPRTYAFGTVIIPNTILEALACSTPVITTNLGGINEIINGENGYTVSPRDSDALTTAMLKLFSNKNKDSFRKNARKTAEKYSWVEIAKKTKRFYGELLK